VYVNNYAKETNHIFSPLQVKKTTCRDENCAFILELGAVANNNISIIFQPDDNINISLPPNDNMNIIIQPDENISVIFSPR
jgi:hypothetical protein